MPKVLKKDFFNRSTLEVAQDLLGKFIVIKDDNVERAYMITDVEAYDGPTDRGSHASKGMTPRTSVMFGEPGYFYVYFTYGIHWMLNVVTREKGYPAAVLIRGVEGLDGPAKFTKTAGIDGRFNGMLSEKKSGLWIEDRGMEVPVSNIKKGPRIGIDYAGPFWASRHWRFFIKRYQGIDSARKYLSFGKGRAGRISAPRTKRRI